MRITFQPNVLQQCPECHHQSVHFFDDVLMCILCGWDAKRTLPKEIVVEGETYVLPDVKPNRQQRRRGKRGRRRAQRSN